MERIKDEYCTHYKVLYKCPVYLLIYNGQHNSSLMDDPTIWQPRFDLPRRYWALLNCFQTNQGHCVSCQKKCDLPATDMCPCGKCQTMSHILNSCPQSKLEGAAVNAVSWYTAEDIRLVNALDEDNNWRTKHTDLSDAGECLAAWRTRPHRWSHWLFCKD